MIGPCRMHDGTCTIAGGGKPPWLLAGGLAAQCPAPGLRLWETGAGKAVGTRPSCAEVVRRLPGRAVAAKQTGAE